MLNRFSFKSIKKAFLVILFFTAVGSSHGYGTDMGPLVVVPATEPTNEKIVAKAREVLESTEPDFFGFKRLLSQRRTNLASLKEPLEQIQTATGKNLLQGCLQQNGFFNELPKELVDIFGMGALDAALKAVSVEKGVRAAALFLRDERRCEGPLPDFLKRYAQENAAAAVTKILRAFYPEDLQVIFEQVPLTAGQKEALCPTLMAWRNKSGQTLAHHFFLSPLALFRLSEITGPEFLDVPDNSGKTVFEDPRFPGWLKKAEISADFLALVTEKVKTHIVKAVQCELGQLSKDQPNNLDSLLGFLVDFPFDADQKEAVKGMLMAWRSGPETGNGTLAHQFAERPKELLHLLTTLTGADILTIPNAAGTLPLHAANLAGFAPKNPGEYQDLMELIDDSSEDEEDDTLEPEKLAILSEASRISDKYGVSAESVAGMHKAFLENEGGVDSFPAKPAIWRDMWGFPEVVNLFSAIMQQPKDFLDPFFQQTYDPSLRQSVNATWSEVFNLCSGTPQYPKYKTQMAHSVQFLDGFMECLTPDVKDEDDADTSIAFVNVLSGHSSFGFNPNRRATDDEANVMVSALLKLGLRAKAQGQKEFFRSFKQDPVDALDAHARVILNNHQLVCAQIAMVGYLAGVDRVNARFDDDVFAEVDRAINSHALFGESKSQATFRKRSEGGAIPDSCFSLSGVLIGTHSYDDDEW